MSFTTVLERASNNIPQKAKPLLAVILNLSFSTLLSYLASPWLSSDLAAVDRPMKSLVDYSSLIAWRIVEVLGYWIGGWDATQAASLSVLSLAPGLHYFHTYHPTHASLFPTLSVSTLIDVISVYLPLRFLRPRRSARESTTDATRVTVALLASMIYQLTLQAAGKRFLTSWLLRAGWELESVERVYSTNEALLLKRALMMLPVGWAATEVIFFSNGKKSGEAEKRDGELVGWFWNLWYKKLSSRTRKVVRRTLLVASYQAAGATAGVAGLVKGGELKGAAGLSSVWALGTVIVGAVLEWVGKA